jgi:hypothetical protein
MPQTILNETERRVLSHLSIPRNVDDLVSMLRTDKGVIYAEDDVAKRISNGTDGVELHKLLEELKSSGLVVNLGVHDDMAKLAHKVESSKARTMPDEKAEIFSRRLSDDEHRWRVKGDVWMYSDDGRDLARESGRFGNYRPPMTTSEVRNAIQNEWGRVVDVKVKGSLHDEIGGKLPDDWDGSLVNALLEEEFRYWLDQVLAEHERVWGKEEAAELRKSLPMAGGSQFSDFYEAIILDAWNQKSSITAAAPWHMALVETTAVTDADTGSTLDEPGYTGYARKTIAAADMNAGSGASGSVTNNAAQVFAACTAGTSTVIGFANCVALTTGQMRSYGTCASTVISTTQTPAQFAVGAYTATVA